jgi:hypothetical protein
MKDPTVEYIHTISDFFNQRAIVRSMFDYNYYSGVHIGPDDSKNIQGVGKVTFYLSNSLCQ